MPPVNRFASGLTLIGMVVLIEGGIARQSQSLKIVVIKGEDAVNIIQQKTAVAPVVEIRDRNNLPVSGAIVTFSITGPGASFGGGLSTLTVTTNAAGQAVAAGLTPTATGAVQINATAAFQGQTVAATITQTNFATAQAAAQTGAATSGSSGAPAGGSAAGGSGGISGTTIGIIGAVVGGGALAATKAAGGGSDGSGGSSQTTTTPPITSTSGAPPIGTPAVPAPTAPAPPSPASGVYRGSFTGTYSSTHTYPSGSCTGGTFSVTGDLTLTLEVGANGSVAGTGDVKSRFVQSSAGSGCAPSMLRPRLFDPGSFEANSFPFSIDFNGPIAGAIGGIRMLQELTETTVGVNRRSAEFLGNFDGTAISGTLTIIHSTTVSDGRGDGSGRFSLTLR